MKCPKCGFNSFEYLDSCKKCGNDLSAFKMSLGLQPVVMQPGVFAGQGTMSEESGAQDSFVPETSAMPAATDEFEFETTSFAPTEAPAMAAEDAAFGEISFEDNSSPGWSGSGQADGLSSQEFEGFNTEPLRAPNGAKEESLADIFGTAGTRAVEKKTDPDDFFNSPELADLFKDDSADKK